jgi:2-polyprenylphenol 6-hydroxylase
MQDCDVAIVGGGLIGASLATALQRCGFQVSMIEAGPAAPRDLAQVELDSRVIAIGHAGIELMRFCGAWPLIDPQRACVYTKVQVEAGTTGKINFDSAAIDFDGSVDSLGYIVENQVLVAGLQASAEVQGVASYFNATVKEISEDGSKIRVILEDTQFSAKLVVAADGGSSQVRGKAGIGVLRSSFNQQGLVARIQVTKPLNKTAWQRFTTDGPLALLPMSDGAYSIVWSTGEVRAQQLMSMPTKEFEDCLAVATQGKFGTVRILDKLRGFPLVSVNAEKYFNGRVVLCGDSAHQIHPLAGQGANLGFKDVIELTDQLLSAKKSRKDLASRKHLRAYERARKSDNILTDSLMSALHDMFAGRMSGVSPVFAVGMSMLDMLSLVKRWLVKQAIEAEPVSAELRSFGYMSQTPDDNID